MHGRGFPCRALCLGVFPAAYTNVHAKGSQYSSQQSRHARVRRCLSRLLSISLHHTIVTCLVVTVTQTGPNSLRTDTAAAAATCSIPTA
eukprot:2031694-Amphidinium_carterae.1